MGSPESRGEGRGPGMRVLVVDDHEDSARSIRVLLRRQGYEVQLAFEGREAIETAKGFRPDVVLLDLTLPDISGAEVAEELRRLEGFEGTALVAISGYRSERLPPAFDGQFPKPLDHDALNGFLARWASGERRTRGDETTPPPASEAAGGAHPLG